MGQAGTACSAHRFSVLKVRMSSLMLQGSDVEATKRLPGSVPSHPETSVASFSLPPLVAGGGCPFRQGESAEEDRSNDAVLAPNASIPMPLPSVPGNSIIEQQILPVHSRLQAEPPGSQALADLKALHPRFQSASKQPVSVSQPSLTSCQSSKELSAPHRPVGAPDPPPSQQAVEPMQQAQPPTPQQIAAFQAAYIQALASQKAMYAQSLQAQALQAQIQAPPMHQQRPNTIRPLTQPRRNGTVPSAGAAAACKGRGSSGSASSESNGLDRRGQGIKCQDGPRMLAQSEAMAPSSQSGPPEGEGAVADEDEEGVNGKVLSTSCAHGPLVTHPAMTQVSGMLASVFPSSNESWLYVTVAGGF